MSASRKAKGKGKGKGKSGKGKSDGRRSQTHMAGLQMPVARIQRYIRRGHYAPKVAKLSGVFMSAVLEYCVAEVLELAGNAAKDQNRKTISPRHILLAIKNDEELNLLLNNVIISHGGVLPHIHPNLVPEKKRKKKSGKTKSSKSGDYGSNSQSF